MNEHVIDYLANGLTKANHRHQHQCHDLSEVKGTQNLLLKYRMKPLLDDAIDAIELDELPIAVNRIKHVLKLMINARQRLNLAGEKL